MSLAVEVWQRDHLTTPGPPTKVCDLTVVEGRRFSVVKNDFGVGSVLVGLNDPNIGEVQPGRLLVFNRGTPVTDGGEVVTDGGEVVTDGGLLHAFLIERRRIATVSEREELGEVLALTCPGVLKVLNDGRNQPPLGAGWLPWDRQRRWDWSSPDLDVTGWTAAVQLWRQGVAGDPATTSSTTFGILHDQGRFIATPPDGFVDGDAYWIWSSTYAGLSGTGDAGTLHMPVGTSYFHKTFTLAAKTKVRVIAGADDYLEVAVDGVHLFATAPKPGNAHDRSRQQDLMLSAGTHTIRVLAENFDRGFTNGNIAGVVLSVHQVDEATEATGDVIVRTDSTWTALDYPATPPGFTPGEILSTLLDEIQAEGFLLDVTLTCGDLLDSDGTAWSEVSDVVTDLGRGFGETLMALAETHIDFRVNADLSVDVWVKGQAGTASGVTYSKGVNIASLEFDGDDLPVSSLLVVHADGVMVIGDDSVGRQEFVDLSSLPQAQATEQATAMLAELQSERWSVALTVEPAGDDRPFDDVGVFDTATVPNPAGSTSVVECTAITWAEDEAGNEILTPEFGDVVLTPEERRSRQVGRTALGSLGGRVIVPPSTGGGVVSSPAGPGGGAFPQITPTRSQVFERPSAATSTESEPWPADVSGAIYEVSVQLNAALGTDLDVTIKVGGVTQATVTVPAGKTTWPVGGLQIPVDKDQSVITVGCASTGFYLQVTVRIA